MNCKNTHQSCTLALTALVFLAAVKSVQAAPYATAITNAAGTVSFRLNENADNVKIISSGGAITNDLGPGLKGLTITNLGIAAGSIKVMVTRSAAAGYTQSSSDSFQDNGIYVNKFEHPRGVVVDKNPASPSFGRIYVSCARQGTTAGSFVRTTFDGIYLLNADNTVALDTGTTPLTAGLPFTTGTETASPLRLTIGKDDNLLYICDLSDVSGGLWVTDLDVTTGANVLDVIGGPTATTANHGSIYAAAVEGSLANGNLTVFTMDEDLLPIRSAWRYDIGSGPLPFAGTSNLLGQAMINTAVDMVKGGSSNYLYASQNRSAGTDAASVRVFTASGVSITNSLDASRAYLNNPTAADLLRNTVALDMSPDGSTLALIQGASFGRVLFVPLTNGVFNFAGTNSFAIGLASDNNRDLTFDAAGNVYIISSSGEWLRSYSKGGASVAITGTDGTFELGSLPTVVNLTATVGTANEQGPVNGVFTLSRVGDTSVPLTVNYTISGTAAGGSDYATLSGAVTFLAGVSSTNIAVAVVDDSEAELTETVIMTLSGSGSYGVGVGSATISILDNEPTEVSVALVQTENRLLEGYSESKVALRLTRRGLIGPALTVNLGYTGGATAGSDFSGPTTTNIAASTATATFTLKSVDDEAYEGTEIVNVSVLTGSGYAVGATNTAVVTVVDDDYPAGAVLFADNFETDSSVNWTVNSDDFGFDSFAEFAYDYSLVNVPPVPGGNTTKALRFRINEQTGAPRNAISASPIPLVLPEEYRMRFKMWVNYNGPMLYGGAGSTYHVTAGVGTTPDHANLGTSAAADGIWFAVSGDGASTIALGDMNAYVTSTLQADDSGVYAAGTTATPRSSSNPYYAIWGGVPAPAEQLANFAGQTGNSAVGCLGISWHTVVISKETNVVTWSVDGIPIAALPADSTPLGTNVFVGYQDLFPGASGVPAMSFALIENFRVETIATAPIVITGIQIVGANVEIAFTGPAENVAGDFKLQSATTVNGTYTDDNAAILSPVGPGSFKATTALSGASHFYKIKL